MGIHERITKLEQDVEALKSGDTAGGYDAAITGLQGEIAQLKDDLAPYADLLARVEKLESTRAVPKKTTGVATTGGIPAGKAAE